MTAERRVRGTRVPARVRIMAWMLGLMTLCLATVVLVVAQQLGSGVDDRANRAIEQETREFATFARQAKDPRTGGLITDPERLLTAPLEMQCPDADEVHLGLVVTDRLHAVRQGEPPYDIGGDTTLLRRIVDDASHELRTPITIVRGQLEVMGDDPAERAEVVRICTDELDRMSRMVEDLLLLARARRPDFLRPQQVSLADLTVDIDAKVRALGDRRWVLESVAEGETWLDPQRVTQAMVQLAQNAVQHKKSGDEIRFGSTQRDGAVSLWITDGGPGIASADLDRIFDRFARGVQGRADRGGAGLGLAIVKAIAEAHHGQVRVLSTPGAGTTIGVTLPSTVEGRP